MTLQEKIEYWRSLHPLYLDLNDVIDTFNKELEALRERIEYLESAKPINGDDIINALTCGGYQPMASGNFNSTPPKKG